MIVLLNDDILGKNIQKYRQKKRLSRRKLAQLSEVPLCVLACLEWDFRREIDLEDLLRLSDVLDTPIEVLIPPSDGQITGNS